MVVLYRIKTLLMVQRATSIGSTFNFDGVTSTLTILSVTLVASSWIMYASIISAREMLTAIIGRGFYEYLPIAYRGYDWHGFGV